MKRQTPGLLVLLIASSCAPDNGKQKRNTSAIGINSNKPFQGTVLDQPPGSTNPTNTVQNTISICRPNYKIKPPEGKIVTGSCLENNGECPEGFASSATVLREIPRADSLPGCQITDDPGERCSPADPKSLALGICLPNNDGSCPAQFVKIKSVASLDSFGCSIRSIKTL